MSLFSSSASDPSDADVKSAGALFLNLTSPGLNIGRTLTAFGDTPPGFFASVPSSLAALVSLSMASLNTLGSNDPFLLVSVSLRTLFCDVEFDVGFGLTVLAVGLLSVLSVP